MPRLSLKTVLLRAIEPAEQDRVSLAQCYDEADPGYAEAMADAKAMLALRETLTTFKKPLTELPSDVQDRCFQALLWAAQWEHGIADANGFSGAAGRDALAAAKLFQKTRRAYFGKSNMEHVQETFKAVPVTEILSDPEKYLKAKPSGEAS